MTTFKAVDFERCRLVRGIKTAALVLVLTAGAVTVDRLFFFDPAARPAAAPVTAKAELPATAATDVFALPEHLRPNAADVVAETPTF